MRHHLQKAGATSGSSDLNSGFNFDSGSALAIAIGSRSLSWHAKSDTHTELQHVAARLVSIALDDNPAGYRRSHRGRER